MQKFWDWYERNYLLNVGLATSFFVLQIFHLIWLFSEVITAKIFGTPIFAFQGLSKILMLLVDYTEIPALLGASLLYINELRKKFSIKSLLYLFFINSQWLHLFWITDEFVTHSFFNTNLAPVWLAWVAILIDYLELPVIFDTLKKFWQALQKEKNIYYAFQKIKEN